jgi:hypothetical protein
VLLVVVAADVRGLLFWAQVGGMLGSALAVGGVVVALVLTALLVLDVLRRRSARSSQWADGSSE